MKYRKKPVVVEAVKFTGNNCFEIMHFMNRSQDIFDAELQETDRPYIHTLEGVLTCSPGDFVIKGVKGEFYPCKPDVFEATYEPIAECPPHDWSQDGERCSKCGCKDWMT